MFKYETIVQFDEHNNPCICGCTVKRLENVEIKCFSRKKAEKGIEWINGQDEPDLKYVEWLEDNIIEPSHNSMLFGSDITT